MKSRPYWKQEWDTTGLQQQDPVQNFEDVIIELILLPEIYYQKETHHRPPKGGLILV